MSTVLEASRRPHRLTARSTGAGFTLIELLITLALSVLLLVAGVPSFASYLTSQRASAASRDLMQDLIAARTEAARTGLRTRLVPKLGVWANGWEVRRDLSPSSIPEDAIIIEDTPVTASVIDLTICSVGGSGDTEQIEFAALGELSAPVEGARAIFSASIGGISAYREVTVGASGRSETRKISAADAETACG